ncbi:MAG: stage V sporulation protein AB [Anaerotignaceae bacterium]
MMDIIKNLILIIIGFSGGSVVAAGIFSFIAAIGIVPRIAARTKTENKIRLYEDFIILGGIFGCLQLYLDTKLHFGIVFAVLIALSIGVFIGCLAISLAEVIDVMPVFMRRARLKTGLSVLIFALALGKLMGSLVHSIFF